MIDPKLLYNGKLIKESEFHISLTNRALRYGDGLFETIKVADGFPLFYRTHHSRFVRGLDAMKMDIPEQFSFFYFKERLIELIEKNEVKNGSIRVQAYRSGAGKYTPDSSAFDWYATIRNNGSNSEFYQFENKEYSLGIFGEVKKHPSVHSFIKSCNAQIYIYAAIFAKQNGLDNVMILNTSDFCIETISENLFLFKKGTVYFPPISDGPVEGVMRATVKKLLIWNKIPFEEKSLTIEDIKAADEIFLTNAVKGIIAVSHFQNKMYTNNFIIGLQAKLNERVASILANRAKH